MERCGDTTLSCHLFLILGPHHILMDATYRLAADDFCYIVEKARLRVCTQLCGQMLVEGSYKATLGRVFLAMKHVSEA